MGILKSFLTMLLSCKFGCHFTCFPKSSICLCPLKLEDTQNSYSSPLRNAQYMEIKSPGDRIEGDKNGSVDGSVAVLPKSSLKRPTEPGCKEVGRRRVKWLDLVGKELVEVREFVPMYLVCKDALQVDHPASSAGNWEYALAISSGFQSLIVRQENQSAKLISISAIFNDP